MARPCRSLNSGKHFDLRINLFNTKYFNKVREKDRERKRERNKERESGLLINVSGMLSVQFVCKTPLQLMNSKLLLSINFH